MFEKNFNGINYDINNICKHSSTQLSKQNGIDIDFIFDLMLKP